MEQISYNCPSDLLAKINDESKVGNFSSRSEFITMAIRYYFESRGRGSSLHEEMTKFLESSEGKNVLLNIFHEFNQRDRT